VLVLASGADRVDESVWHRSSAAGRQATGRFVRAPAPATHRRRPASGPLPTLVTYLDEHLSNTLSCGRRPARRGLSSPSNLRPSSNHVSQVVASRRSKCRHRLSAPIRRYRWAKFSSASIKLAPPTGRTGRWPRRPGSTRLEATSGPSRPSQSVRSVRAARTGDLPTLELRARPHHSYDAVPTGERHAGSASRHPSRCFPVGESSPCRRSGVPRPGSEQIRGVAKLEWSERRTARAAAREQLPNIPLAGPSPRACVRSLFPLANVTEQSIRAAELARLGERSEPSCGTP